MPDPEAEIDRLYQLPLNEFTPARNVLAKTLQRADLKKLEKPNSAAWAVNQLYWQQRALFDRLVRAAEQLRAEHGKLLGGREADIRGAEAAHRAAVREASEKARELLQAGGQAATPATLTAVQETLEALPVDERPGRLTRPLKPRGFEALAGIPVRSQLRVVRGAPEAARGKRDGEGSRKESAGASRAAERAEARRREKEERERKERQREAEKALKAAEAAMLRAEDAVKKAEKTLAELRARRDEAVNEYQRARLRAHQ